MTGRRTVAIATITAVLASAGTATAAKLITSSDIKDGTIANRDVKKNTISLNRLSPGVRKLIAKAPVAGVSRAPTPVGGQPGAAGAAGAPGANGNAGAAGSNGTAGANGGKGADGAPGANGSDGANPAAPVRTAGDQGFQFSGTPAATFERGALHLHGGFDGKTPQGAPGLAKPFDSVALDTLSALGYTFAENKRSTTDKRPRSTSR